MNCFMLESLLISLFQQLLCLRTMLFPLAGLKLVWSLDFTWKDTIHMIKKPTLFQESSSRKHQTIHLPISKTQHWNACTLCEEPFTTSFHLRVHKIIHPSKKPFNVDAWWQVTIDISSLAANTCASVAILIDLLWSLKKKLTYVAEDWWNTETV